MHPLAGKVALVTGASSGIGRGVALRLASFGARIALVARTRETLEEVADEVRKQGAEALVLPTDVADSAQCHRAIVAAVEHFGRLDALICSAGVSMRCYFAGSDLATLERVMRVNFLGTLYCTHFALRYIRQTRGSLIALSSLTGIRGIPSYAVYGASKFAIQGLYESLRLELWRDGVHVGVVSPGFVDTRLRDQVLGPDGKPWATPPAPPFRVWPVEKCVDRVVRLLLRRRRRALLPAFIGPLLWLDEIVGRIVGDFILRWKFPPDHPGCQSR